MTFERIHELEGVVAKILWCPQSAFSLHKIKTKPLTLQYTFSASDVPNTFPLTEIQWKQLKVNGIAELHCSYFDYQDDKSGKFLLPIFTTQNKIILLTGGLSETEQESFCLKGMW